jgi:hypothetical protein
LRAKKYIYIRVSWATRGQRCKARHENRDISGLDPVDVGWKIGYDVIDETNSHRCRGRRRDDDEVGGSIVRDLS